MDFEAIKQRLLALARANGMTDDALSAVDPRTGRFAWQTDWGRDLASWSSDIAGALARDIRQFDRARDDRLVDATHGALLNTRDDLDELIGLMTGLRHDINKMLGDRRFGWPGEPDGRCPATDAPPDQV